MAAKKTAYNRAFGGGADNLWETVDTIMVDLLHQGGDGSGSTDTDIDSEKNNSATKKKEQELDEMMENLDTLLDDLKDISSISNDSTTPPRSINTSAEKIKPKRPTNDEFLEKENPLDSITQGLLYQTADVPLFASSSDMQSPSPQPQSSAEEEYNEEESEDESDGWGDDPPNEVVQPKEQSGASSNRASSEIEDLQLPTEEDLSMEEKVEYQDALIENEIVNTDQGSTNADVSAEDKAEAPKSRLYAAATKAEQTRRLDIRDKISKYQELSKITESQRTNKPAAAPPRSIKSVIHASSKSPAVHHEVSLPSTSYRSRPFSTATSSTGRIGTPPTSRALPQPPNASPLSVSSQPSDNPAPSTTNKTSPLQSPTSTSSPTISPNTSATDLSSSVPSSTTSGLPPQGSPKPPRPPRPNAPKKSPQSQPTESVPAKRAAFAPSVRSTDHVPRSQINIGQTRTQLRTSSEGLSSAHNEDSVSATSPIAIPSHTSAFSSVSPAGSSSSSSTSPTPPDLNDLDTSPSSDSILQREASMRRVLSSPLLRENQHNPALQRNSSQNSIQKQQKTNANTTHFSMASSPSPSSTSPPTVLGKSAKSLRLTPVGQHRTPTRLIFGGDGISVREVPNSTRQQPNGQLPTSPLSQTSSAPATIPETISNSNGQAETETHGITSRHAAPMEVKERNAKIKQLRDLMRRYRTKLIHMETKHARDAQELSARIATGTKDAQIHLRSCITWGQHVLTRACRASWQWKIFVLQYRYELHTMQSALLQAKLELVDQLMTLLEIEYKNAGKSPSAKNDFVIYSSFFKDPSEVMTSPEVERNVRILPKLMRAKRRAKLEFQRLRNAYQPEPPDRRMRRVKDILSRMHPSPLLPNYYSPDDVLQADFDSVVTDQRLLEGRHIQHLKNFLQEDLAGERSITPNEISDFLLHFAQKMAETFGVNAHDANKLLLLSKRAIYPRIYHLLLAAIPASVREQDAVLAAQLAWIQKLDPVVLREGLKLDKRSFQNPKAAAAFEPAIEALNELSFLIVPTDMSVAVHRAFKLTHDITLAQLRTQGAGSSEMGMDDVFPMFLWVVTQCNVARLCQCVYFLDFFSDNDEKISILGYAATSLAAAVAHLSQIEKEVFNNNVVQ